MPAICRFLPLLAAGAAFWLAGCSSGPAQVPHADATTGLASDWARASYASAGTATPWQHYTLPGKQANRYEYTHADGRAAVVAHSSAGVSMLRQKVRIEPEELGRVRFSWKVPVLIAEADLSQRDTADSPVRLVLAFEGDRSKFSMRNAMLSELARSLTGEELPYATLMYVWSNRHPQGTVIPSARTDRIRKLVLESGPGKLGQWLDYARDIRADYEKAFGEAPGALVGVALMTDTDNTRATAQAWYGPVQLDATLVSRR